MSALKPIGERRFFMDDNLVERENPSARSTDTPSASEYGREYFDTYGHLGYSREIWLESFRGMADQIVRQINPRRVLDVGCAKGFLIECLRDRGVEAYGFDISEYAVNEARPDVRPYCWVGSAANSINERYDLITCIEVCEHLPEPEANEAVRQMASHSDMVLFSSSPGHFDEPTHLNVHPVIDWLRLFAQFSFTPDTEFDAGFLSPQAILFRRAAVPPSDRDLCQFAHAKNRAIALEELQTSPRLSPALRELDTIRNSKGWKLLNRFRNLRARVKDPIARALRKLNLIRS